MTSKQLQNSQSIVKSVENSSLKQQSFFKIINPEDYSKWKQSKNKIIIAPLAFCTAATVFVLLAGKFQIRKLLSNPLLKEDVLQRSNNRWKFLIKHTIIFGTLAFAAGAYFKKQFNKYLIFKEYEKEVNYYMRWKIQNQIIGFINQDKVQSQEEKLKKVVKLF